MSSNRKKILWLASWYPNRQDPFDGDFIQRHARAAAINNDIHVIVVKETSHEKAEEEDWNHGPGLTEQIIYFQNKKGLLGKFEKQLKWRRLYLNAISEYLKKNGRPALLHVHVPWKVGLIALEVKKRYGIPYLITEHWGMYNSVLSETYGNKPIHIKLLLKAVFSRASHLITPSTYLARAINQMVTPIDFTVIPNVVDTSLFFPTNEKSATFTFLHVSNMVPLKNVPAILSAFKLAIETNHINIRLVLLGNRDNHHLTLAKQMGLLDKTVFFKGEVPYSEVAEEMQSAHCLILNSTLENSPCVIGEALCCGLPVITTKVGGIPELVDAGNSFFVAENNVQKLADAMIDMHERYSIYEPSQIATRAQKKFSYAKISMLHDEVYERFRPCNHYFKKSTIL